MRKEKIPNSLQAARWRAGLYQRHVAEALKFCTTDRISRWEKGTAIPDIVNLFKLCHLYGCLPQDLYHELFILVKNGVDYRTLKRNQDIKD